MDLRGRLLPPEPEQPARPDREGGCAMDLGLVVLALVPIGMGVFTAVVAERLLRRFHTATGPSATLLFAGLSIWLLFAGLSILMKDPDDQILVRKIIYLGVVSVPLAFFLLAARAVRRDAWLGRRALLALWAIPVFVLALALTNDSHGWLWPKIELVPAVLGHRVLRFHFGPGFWLLAAYSYVALGAGTWLLASKYRRDWRHYRLEASLVFAALAAPWIANVLYLAGYAGPRPIDPTPYALTLTSAVLAWGLARQGILEALPVSRSTVVARLSDGILVVDTRRRIVDANAAARRVLGLEDVFVQDLRVDDALAGFPKLLEALDEPAKEATSALEIRTPEGPRSFDLRICELREKGRDLSGHLVVLRDVTDYLAATEAARAAAVAKSQFLANMSHEIRTPMNGVLGHAQHLAELGLDAEQRSVVDDILRSGEALLQVLDDVLDFSKLEAGKLRIDSAPFEPRALADDLVVLLGPKARENGIALETEIDAGVPFWLVGDAGRIRQVLVNLGGNAVKFTKQGRVVLRVRCDAIEAAVATLRFEVSDTGIGIPASALETIFDAFTQADASTTRRFGGTGLGLSISRELVQRMGGELGVSSEVGRGSSFWFVLPLPVCAAPLVSPRERFAARSTAGRALRVLAAEDNPVNQRVLRRLLERLGCSVDLASDGAEAVSRLESGEYDLVLMDCQMPGIDGFEATRRIRSLAGSKARIPIVAVTAHALEGDRERCLAAGMDDYVTKPLRPDSLARIVERFGG